MSLKINVCQCGSEATAERYGANFFVVCKHCGWTGPSESYPATASLVWNRPGDRIAGLESLVSSIEMERDASRLNATATKTERDHVREENAALKSEVETLRAHNERLTESHGVALRNCSTLSRNARIAEESLRRHEDTFDSECDKLRAQVAELTAKLDAAAPPPDELEEACSLYLREPFLTERFKSVLHAIVRANQSTRSEIAALKRERGEGAK